MLSREERVAVAGQARIMRYLAANEGMAFTRAQLCCILEIHPATIDRYIQRIRKNHGYSRYFRTVYVETLRGEIRKSRVCYHYVLAPGGTELRGI